MSGGELNIQISPVRVTVDALTEPWHSRLQLCGRRLLVGDNGNGAKCPIHGHVDPGPAVAPGVHVCRVAR